MNLQLVSQKIKHDYHSSYGEQKKKIILAWIKQTQTQIYKNIRKAVKTLRKSILKIVNVRNSSNRSRITIIK